jgi:serine protease Do
MFRVFAALLGVMLLGPWSARAGETAWETLFEERVGTVVAVNYTIEREIDRQRSNAVGLVVDDEGLIVLLSSAFPDWLPVDRVTGLEVQLPRSRGERFTAEYLGQDYLNGWHYVRAAPEAWGRMRSIRSFPVAVPRVGEILWGVCLTDETLDFMPYFRDGRLSAAQAFPLLTGFLTADVATPGGPVFDRRGHFAGWAGLANPVEREMWIAGEVYRVNLRNNIESHAFLFAEEFLAQLGRLPPAPDAGPRPWLGVAGLQPLDRDTAEFLGLEDQGAVVVSEILPGSPAAAAGFQPRDIVVAVEGERLRRFKPDSVVQVALERAIRGTAVGQSMNFTVVRGEEELDLTATLAQGPTPVREAAREYFPSLGAAPLRRGWPTRSPAPSPRTTPSSPSSTAPTSRTTATCATSAASTSWSPAYSFMIRVRVPGGVCHPARSGWRWTASPPPSPTAPSSSPPARPSSSTASSRATSSDHARDQRGPLDTIAACGDVNRNVMCNPNPYQSKVHAEVLKVAQASATTSPRARAYHEIWLDGEKKGRQSTREEEEEPIYGKTYLPRKFKIVVAVPPSNDVDIYANDLGFIAIVEDGETRRLQRRRRRRHGHDPRQRGNLSAPRRR